MQLKRHIPTSLLWGSREVVSPFDLRFSFKCKTKAQGKANFLLNFKSSLIYLKAGQGKAKSFDSLDSIASSKDGEI